MMKKKEKNKKKLEEYEKQRITEILKPQYKKQDNQKF